MNKPEILIADIETLPALGAFFDLKHDLSPHNVIEPSSLACASWQVLGDSKIRTVCVSHKDIRNDIAAVQDTAEAFSKADVIIGHYFRGFDARYVAGRVLVHDLPPIKPASIVDTYYIAIKHFHLYSYRLSELAKILNVPHKKIKTEFELWKRCLRGEKAAFEEMKRYNRGDIRVERDVFKRLVPYSCAAMPRQDGFRCRHCYSRKLNKNSAFKFTTLKAFAWYQCDECGGWSHGRQDELKSKQQLTGAR